MPWPSPFEPSVLRRQCRPHPPTVNVTLTFFFTSSDDRAGACGGMGGEGDGPERRGRASGAVRPPVRSQGRPPPLQFRSRPPRRGPDEAYPEGPGSGARAHTQRRCPLTPRTAHHTPLVAVLQSAARARCTGPTCGRRYERRGSTRSSEQPSHTFGFFTASHLPRDMGAFFALLRGRLSVNVFCAISGPGLCVYVKGHVVLFAVFHRQPCWRAVRPWLRPIPTCLQPASLAAMLLAYTAPVTPIGAAGSVVAENLKYEPNSVCSICKEAVSSVKMPAPREQS